DICTKAEGQFAQIAQDGGVQIVATPFDKRLSEINGELAKDVLVFGADRTLRADAEKKKEEARNLGAAPTAPKADVAAAAERAAFNLKSGKAASFDLLDAINQGKVKLEDLKKDELPEELKGKSLDEQKKYLKSLEEKREKLKKEVLDLDKKRTEYIKDE